MKKFILLIMVFSLFGCIDFKFNPNVNIKINQTENIINQTNQTSEPPPPPPPKETHFNMKFPELFKEKEIKCVLNGDKEQFIINKNNKNIEIVFMNTEYFDSIKKINCNEVNCKFYNYDNTYKAIDSSFIETIILLYEDYDVECFFDV